MVRKLGAPLTIDEVPVPEPVEGMVQVAVQVSGVCQPIFTPPKATGPSNLSHHLFLAMKALVLSPVSERV